MSSFQPGWCQINEPRPWDCHAHTQLEWDIISMQAHWHAHTQHTLECRIDHGVVFLSYTLPYGLCYVINSGEMCGTEREFGSDGVRCSETHGGHYSWSPTALLCDSYLRGEETDMWIKDLSVCLSACLPVCLPVYPQQLRIHLRIQCIQRVLNGKSDGILELNRLLWNAILCLECYERCDESDSSQQGMPHIYMWYLYAKHLICKGRDNDQWGPTRFMENNERRCVQQRASGV